MSRPYSESMVMRPAVTYTPYGKSQREQTGGIITFAQFEEGVILTKTHNDAESGGKSDNKSIMMSEKDMDAINYADESDHGLISTEMLEEICDGSKSHPNIHRRESHYKIRDCINVRMGLTSITNVF